MIGHFNPVQQIGDFIYSFHMPLFFFLSGVTFWYSFGAKLSKENYKKIIPQTLGKRFCSLCLPYAAWSLMRFFICGDSIAESFDRLWFLPTLFGIIIIFILVELMTFLILPNSSELKLLCAEILLSAFLCGVLLLLVKFTDIKLFREILIYVYPFYMGFALKKYNHIQKIFSNQFVITFCLIMFCILVPLYSQNDKSIIVLAVRYITGICFTIVLYYASRTYVQGGVNQMVFSIFELLGKNTLKIYIIHDFFRPLFSYGIILNYFWDMVLKIIGAAIVCLCCVVVGYVLSQSNILKFVLFGEMKAKNNKLSEVTAL
ncbi:MAG: acyltransferase [Eubacterium sp.]|nr:acyltransferase [Eubacterium sp.]